MNGPVDWTQVCGVHPYSLPLTVIHFCASDRPDVLDMIAAQRAGGWESHLRLPGHRAEAVRGSTVVVLHDEAIRPVSRAIGGRLPTVAVWSGPPRPMRQGKQNVHVEVVPDGRWASWRGIPLFVARAEEELLMAAIICRAYAFGVYRRLQTGTSPSCAPFGVEHPSSSSAVRPMSRETAC